jgi:hypothetical protein
MVQQPSGGVWLRRADNNERFVAFAFAAADLVVETEASGRVMYAAGAFRPGSGSKRKPSSAAPSRTSWTRRTTL